MTTIFAGWEPRHTEMFGRFTLKLAHRLHESELFTDEALARLIEGYPASHYNLHSMGSPDDPRFLWRRGLLGTCAGADVIAGIRAGRLWLNLRRVHEVSEPYAKLLDGIFAETEANVPGLHTFKHNFGILISSPRAQVYYHSDIPGQALWQIRGTKRIWIYPNTEPFLRERDIEGAILGVTEEEMPYHQWFDEHAEVHDLMPGEMLHWPLNGPHRVVNHDCMNVSVTTEHWTADIRKSYAVRYANAVLRRAGWRSPSAGVRGPAVYAKAALTMAHRKFLRPTPASSAPAYDFTLDATSQGRMIDLPSVIAAE